MGGQKVMSTDLLAFDQLQRGVNVALEGGVSKAQVSQLYAAPETFAKFREEITEGLGKDNAIAPGLFGAVSAWSAARRTAPDVSP